MQLEGVLMEREEDKGKYFVESDDEADVTHLITHEDGSLAWTPDQQENTFSELVTGLASSASASVSMNDALRLPHVCPAEGQQTNGDPMDLDDDCSSFLRSSRSSSGCSKISSRKKYIGPLLLGLWGPCVT